MIPETIEHALTNIEVELEKVAVSKKEQALDMTDSYRNSLKGLFPDCEICEDKGTIEVGEHDDITTKKCVCQVQDDTDDDS